jgi:hypothetical protein
METPVRDFSKVADNSDFGSLRRLRRPRQKWRGRRPPWRSEVGIESCKIREDLRALFYSRRDFARLPVHYGKGDDKVPQASRERWPRERLVTD